MKKYTIEKLLDDALDTSSAEYQMILNAFDGVKADPRAEMIWYYAIRKYLEDYNAASDDWDMIPADLSTAGRKAMIEKAVLSIIRDSICTTKSGVEYYRFGDCVYNDNELTDTVNIDKILEILS